MTRKLITILLILGIIIALIIGINWIKRFFQIDSCLDRGGRWNYELNECEKGYNFRSDTLTKFYWYSEHDSINNNEFLIKGELLDSTGKVPFDLVEILNRRESKSKIEIIEFQEDTIKIRILNDEFLSEHMGTTGAYCFLGETVLTLTEIESINFVRIEMNIGSHAGPGLYNRNDFKDLIR